ncbi:MAG: hypothetical protein KF722_05835 [Nitrospira sp.]|nr:hypothetical protein [Nitrospira sp.]
MNLLLKAIRWTVKIVTLTLLGIQSLTPAMASVRDGDFTLRTPLSEAVLDCMRGGFQRDPDGPFMSFGIERNVFINEKLVSSTMLNIPDLKRLADHRDFNPFPDHRDMKSFVNDSDMRSSVDHSGMKPFADRPSDTLTLIQSGPGNSVPHDVSSLPPFMTLIQNSLDNRAIQSETVINATVEALTWARSLHLGNALSQASIEAIRH